ncbi:MAG: hypothetical protein ABIQ30_13655 [Devosia sp.]
MSVEKGNIQEDETRPYRVIRVLQITIFVLVVLATGFFTVFDLETRQFRLESLNSELFVAVFVGVLVTLFFDIVTRRQDEKISAIERRRDQEAVRRDLARDVLLSGEAEKLSPLEVRTITHTLLKKGEFLDALVKETIANPKLSENLKQAVMQPAFADHGLVHFTKWDNTLKRDPDDPGSYFWESDQEMTLLKPQKHYRVAITADASLGDDLLNSSIVVNNLVVPATYDRTAVEGSFAQTYRLSRGSSGGGDAMIGHVVSLDDMTTDKVDRARFKSREHEVTFLQFEGGNENDERTFSFSVKCAFNEPYFYIEPEHLCFVDKINIDYSDIQHLFDEDSIWPRSFIINPSCRLSRKQGVFSADIRGGVVAGGHGMMLIWQPKPLAKPRARAQHNGQ